MKVSPLAFAACALVSVAACHTPGTPDPPAKTPFVASQFPAGEGWYCYKANEGYDAAACERTKDACDAKHKKDVNAKTECSHDEQAYCFAVNGVSPTLIACYGTQRECTNASNAKREVGTPTECGAVK